jgi:hypothetical protein
MKKLAGLYDQLSNQERFSAFIAAGSRLDTDEMDLLNDTCPRKTYTMDDWEYTVSKQRFFGCLVMMQLRLGRLTSALAALALTAAYAEDDEADKSMDTARRVVTHHRALFEAWGRFCEQIGIDRAVGLAILNQDKSDFDVFLLDLLSEDTIGDIPDPEVELVECEVGKLMEAWG